jgi:tetratricopeptide (TPR) repeat protein
MLGNSFLIFAMACSANFVPCVSDSSQFFGRPIIISSTCSSWKYFFKKGITAAKRYKSKIWEGILYGNLGEFYYLEKKFDSSLVYFRKNHNFNKAEAQHPTVKINSDVNMAKAYLALDSVQKANEFLKMAENSFSNLLINSSYDEAKYLGDRQQIESSKRHYFEVKTNYFKKTGHFQTALQYQDSLMRIRKEIERKYNSAEGTIASNRLKIQKRELQLAQKEQEKAHQRFYHTVLISFIIILGGLGYFYMYRSRQKKKRQNERLIATNRISILDKQQTQKDLEVARNEINHFISKFNEQNKIISAFEKDLEKLQGLKEEEQMQVRETLTKMKKVKILTEEDWINFQDNFDRVFSEFRIGAGTAAHHENGSADARRRANRHLALYR